MFSFDTLRLANKKRLPLFKNKHGLPAHARPDGSDWDFATWLQAVMGELGEVAELRLAYEHGLIKREEYKLKIAQELADVTTYIDLLALRSTDMPVQPETGVPRMNDPYLMMHLISAIGIYANMAKKFIRGDINRGDFIDRKVDLLSKAGSALQALALSKGLKAPEPRATGDGINLGEAVVTTFNNVSDRVGADVKLVKNKKTCGDCGSTLVNNYAIVEG